MRRALELAARGDGAVEPNPQVGCVIAHGEEVVGEGWHARFGGPHAERAALDAAGSRARGATLYVTLEPCCHLNKRTPPCVPEVIRSGVSRVVIAMTDPNPAVKGRGFVALRRAGLSVTGGIAQAEAETLNEAYAHWTKAKRPYVILKAGMTLDGKIATASGESMWITCKQSRQEVHDLRACVDAVMVGIGTVLADDPALTARIGPQLNRPASTQPLRIVVDSTLRIPMKAKVLSGQKRAKTIVATTDSAPASRRRVLLKQGIEVLTLPTVRGKVSLSALMRELGRRDVTSLLVEGGGEINAAMLQAKLVQHVRLYMAAMLLGGINAKSVIGGKSPVHLASAFTLHNLKTRFVGGDLVVEGKL